MSLVADAVAALKALVLIEERLKTQAAQIERLANQVADHEGRLIRVETSLAIAFKSGTGGPRLPPGAG